MKVFVTGATGFIGSRVAKKLLAAGHQVVGLTRGESGAKALQQMGAEVHFGTLENPESISQGLGNTDAVIHTAFDHNFVNMVENCQKDKRVIEAIGKVLKNSNRPFIITSGIPMGSMGDGQMAMEDNFNPNGPNPRVISELTGNELLEEGLDVRVVRLAQVHNTERQGLISPWLDVSAKKGMTCYLGDGKTSWSAVHVDDAVDVFLLALTKGQKGKRYHAVGEEGIPSIDIAKAIGAGFGIPVKSVSEQDAPEYFGWLVRFMSHDMTGSSAKTRMDLGWSPSGPTLLQDLKNVDYANWNSRLLP